MEYQEIDAIAGNSRRNGRGDVHPEGKVAEREKRKHLGIIDKQRVARRMGGAKGINGGKEFTTVEKGNRRGEGQKIDEQRDYDRCHGKDIDAVLNT